MVTVGENFKRMRLLRRLTQEQVYEALGFQRVSNVSLLERSKRLPKPRTIKRMAAVLKCETWELLEGVQTPHDELRQATVTKQRIPPHTKGESVPKRDGRSLAGVPVAADAQADSVPRAPSSVDRGIVAGVERYTRSLEHAAAVATGRGAAGKRPATAGAKKAAGGGRAGSDRG